MSRNYPEVRNLSFRQGRCKNCNRIFKPSQWNQIYCGSKTGKKGCSYKMHKKRILAYNLSKNRAWMLKYNKKWKKEQRRKNTDYAKRQRVLKREKGRSKEGKKVARAWRKLNINKVLLWNRKRILKKKGVNGTHTSDEWIDLKKKFNNSCANCGISEETLRQKWKGTHFTKLTRDHIIPISKNGTDYIKNIQPLCVSCNARKKDEGVMQNG
jgi:hypothetical protein